MCGLIAAVTSLPTAAGAARSASVRMRRRGPDDEGFRYEGNACFGHCRLGIQNLDGCAAQPVHSACGELVPLQRGFGRLQGKPLLARSPALALPTEIIGRSKAGFGIPVECWLRESARGAQVEGGSRGWVRRIAKGYNEASA